MLLGSLLMSRRVTAVIEVAHVFSALRTYHPRSSGLSRTSHVVPNEVPDDQHCQGHRGRKMPEQPLDLAVVGPAASDHHQPEYYDRPEHQSDDQRNQVISAMCLRTVQSVAG